MTNLEKRIKLEDVLGNKYYNYNLTSSNYNPSLNSSITLTCLVTNILGDAVSGKELQLSKNGTSLGTSYKKTTNSSGVATWSITCTDGGLQTYSIDIEEIEIFVDNKANSTHTHTTSNITDFPNLSNVATSGSYNDLSDKPTIPTNVSSFVNDSGYLTTHQDISGKLDKTQNSYKGKNVVVDSSSGEITFEDKNNHTHSSYLTSSDISGKANISDLSDVAISGSYDDLTDKPTIPTVPTNISSFTNDSGYLTSHQDITGKEDKSNKVTSWSSTTTDTNYPSEKLVKDSLDSKANSGHTHNGYALSNHSHGNLMSDGAMGKSGVSNKNVVTNGNGYLTTEDKPNIPSDVSELTDTQNTAFTPKSHTHTKSQITDFPTIPSASISIPSADTTNGSIGSGTTWAKADHQHPKSSIYADANHNHNSLVGESGLTLIEENDTDNTLNALNNKFIYDYGLTNIIYYDRDGTGFGDLDYEVAVKGDIPTDVSDLTDISNTAFTPKTHTHTKSQITDFPTLATVATSGSYNDLTNKPSIPSKTSDLTNDSNFISTSSTNGLVKNDGSIDTNTYLTTHQDISGKANINDLGATAFSNDYTDLDNKPSIPSDVSDLTDTNNTQFTPKSHTHGNLQNDGSVGTSNNASKNVVTDSNGKITTEAKPTIPSKTSDLTNDSGFLTSSDNWGNFTELKGLINNASSGDTIVLEKNYRNSDNVTTTMSDSPNKEIHIDGNGHIIDFNNLSSALNLIHDKSSIENCILININNSITLVGDYTSISNCTIKGVTNASSSIVMLGINTYVTDCIFFNNAYSGCLLIQASESNNHYGNKYIKNCLFIDNNVYAPILSTHGANSKTFVDSCQFINNTTNQGAIVQYVASTNKYSNCIFNNNTSSQSNTGGAITLKSSDGAVLINNKFLTSNDTIYPTGAVNKDYLTEHQDISGKENSSNKVKSTSGWNSTTTDDHYPSEKLVKDSLNGKQDSLISGTNIKTINNNSLLGSGNISVGSHLNDFYGDSSTNELIIDYDTGVSQADIVTSWSSTTSDSNVPSEKLVKDSIDSLNTLIGNAISYNIISSNYNPNIDSTVTITITVTDADGNSVPSHSFTLNADGTNVSLTTNSNGVATHTYTCSKFGIRRFYIDGYDSCTIKVGGWKTYKQQGVWTVEFNETHTRVTLASTTTVNVTTTETLYGTAILDDDWIRPTRPMMFPTYNGNVMVFARDGNSKLSHRTISGSVTMSSQYFQIEWTHRGLPSSY